MRWSETWTYRRTRLFLFTLAHSRKAVAVAVRCGRGTGGAADPITASSVNFGGGPAAELPLMPPKCRTSSVSVTLMWSPPGAWPERAHGKTARGVASVSARTIKDCAPVGTVDVNDAIAAGPLTSARLRRVQSVGAERTRREMSPSPEGSLGSSLTLRRSPFRRPRATPWRDRGVSHETQAIHTLRARRWRALRPLVRTW